MQNISTGMFATMVPVGVVPSPPKWPSWKIHTSAPKDAVSDKTLSTNAFSGSTTLPVSSGAVLLTVRNALPSLTAVAADGGPAGLPPTNVAPGAETDVTSVTSD